MGMDISALSHVFERKSGRPNHIYRMRIQRKSISTYCTSSHSHTHSKPFRHRRKEWSDWLWRSTAFGAWISYCEYTPTALRSSLKICIPRHVTFLHELTFSGHLSWQLASSTSSSFSFFGMFVRHLFSPAFDEVVVSWIVAIVFFLSCCTNAVRLVHLIESIANTNNEKTQWMFAFSPSHMNIYISACSLSFVCHTHTSS